MVNRGPAFVSCLALIAVFVGNCLGSEYPEVNSPLGRVRGYYRTTDGGRNISAFEGVPFAKPPVGELRFEEPQEVEAWLGTWIANQLYVCPQPGFSLKEGISPGVVGSEDCLYLNIYVPRENPSENDNLDVVVHIHGGGFMIGSGHMYTGPNSLLDREVILVTVNYRIGALGFLSTQDGVVPGNNGLKDQILALKWVQQNIRSFGGNSNSVTIDGFSAGGSSVHFHYLSPLSRGFFHRGYSHSGTALNAWAFQDVPLEKFQKLSQFLGCSESSVKEAVDCLKSRPLNQVIEGQQKFKVGQIDPVAPFGPVVEKNSKKPFLEDHPYNLLARGEINEAPWINLFAADDFAFVAGLFESNVDALNANWDDWIHHILASTDTVAQQHKDLVAKQLKEFYIGEESLSIRNFRGFAKMVAERMIILDAVKAASLHAQNAKSPVYNILYNYKTENGFMKLLPPQFQAKSIDIGAVHGDDIILTYGSTVPGLLQLTETDLQMNKILLDSMESFARDGVPKIEGVELKPDPGHPNDWTYLQLNNPDDIKMQKDSQYSEAIEFWASLPILENENLVKLKDEL